VNAEINDNLHEPGDAVPLRPLVTKRFIPTVVPPAKPGPRLLIAHDPFDPHCEKIRALRTELLLRRETVDEADIVVVLSPCAGDGRSQLAAELAIAFAQLDRPTLLVDADLRNPSQHMLFNASNQIGLAQAIAHANPQFRSVEGVKQLSLLTAGPTPDNPLELLLDGRFTAMMDEWRNMFDFVVVDTAPVTHYSDGLAVANLVKRVLAVSRAKHTPYKDSCEMLRRLQATRSQIVGAVINHF
jgi:receptor protein-tyrosine kinase